jgi:hypothetical protein
MVKYNINQENENNFFKKEIIPWSVTTFTEFATIAT